MCFRLAMFLFVFYSTSCSWWGGEKTESNRVYLREQEFLGNSGACISETDSFFEQYFKGHSLDRNIDYTFSCLEEVIDKIFEHAEEKNRSKGFSKKEVAVVFKSVFPEKTENAIQKNIDFLFVFKRLVSGGSKNNFSREEWAGIKKEIPNIASIFKNAKSDIKYFFYDRGASFFKRKNGFENLKKTFVSLDQLKSDLGGSIEEDEVRVLLNYIFDGRDYSRFKGLALVAKDFIFSSGKVFERSQKFFFERIYYVLEMQSRFASVDFSEGFFWGSSLFDLRRALDIVGDKLEEWSRQDQKYVLERGHVLELLLSLKSAGLFVDHLSNPEAIDETIANLGFKLFGERSYTNVTFAKIKDIIVKWKFYQNFLLKEYDFPWLRDFKENLSKAVDLRPRLTPTPKFIKEKNGPIIYTVKEESHTDSELYFDKSFKVFLKVLIDEVIESYSEDSDKDFIMRGKFLSEEGLGELYEDISPLGLELGIMNPYSCDAHKRAFIEIDSFTILGDGNSKVTSNELQEWLGLMLSVTSISSYNFERMDPSCYYPGDLQLGYPFLKRDCIQNNFFDKAGKIGKYYPDLLAYTKILKSDGLRKKFQDNLKAYSRYFYDFEKVDYPVFLGSMANTLKQCQQEDFPYSRDELNTSLALIFYIENIYHQFDRETFLEGWLLSSSQRGQDFVIDGREFSQFARVKIKNVLPNMVQAYREENPDGNIKYLTDSRLLWLIRNMPRKGVLFDRFRVYSLFQKFLGSFETEKQNNEHLQNFCREVYESKDSYITFKRQKNLTCEEKQ